MLSVSRTLWSVIKMARPESRRFLMICCTSYTAIGSTPLNGSSNMSKLGRVTSDRETAFFTTGKRQRELFGHVFDAELVQQFLAAMFPLLLVQRLGLEDRHDVLLDRHLAKD